MSDLVERLRRAEPCREGCGAPCRVMDAASGCVCAEAAARIEQLEADNTRLRVENIQMQAALGYAICAEDERHIIPSNPFKCGVCDARARAALGASDEQ